MREFNLLYRVNIYTIYHLFIFYFSGSLSYGVVYYTYETSSLPGKLIQALHHPVDFLLFTLANLVNRDGIPWFHQWSAGNLLTYFFSIFNLFIILFYNW